ncbi:hypothetical protein CEXT_185121 [Caerostris extrusa]|uniref:Uncharacterized protein n=1 Tax=Caerostris extrusa TaxID=172846 RepID=A0AAV4TJG2_CAEEX|nr:hypothetical protein CEXT_185121 [Caerostris extrusa]
MPFFGRRRLSKSNKLSGKKIKTKIEFSRRGSASRTGFRAFPPCISPGHNWFPNPQKRKKGSWKWKKEKNSCGPDYSWVGRHLQKGDLVLWRRLTPPLSVPFQ